ncbi:pyruvate kinase-like [Spodoptera litura]|uniref:Pyruvate kinase-like n=1 Tax=Spodoptera litura TaxID=69820 RepID=A0A9J7IRX7_SPOLT|nr:pyruvate kinase-like [Spodoptera litura]
MVWWMNHNPSKQKEGVFNGVETKNDTVYETINIMYDCYNVSYDRYDIRALVNAGVNIINVDMTIHNNGFFQQIKIAVDFFEKIPQIMPSLYIPVGLSVTMSALNPIDLDNRVDIIILKDVTSTNQLREFKKQNKKLSSMTILLWPPSLGIVDLNELIKISSGLVLDPSMGDVFNVYYNVLKLCTDARKPVFYMHPNIVEDYYEGPSNDRELLIQVRELITNQFDGVILKNHGKQPPIAFIQSFVRATEILENKTNLTADYFNKSFPLLLPVLQPYSVALAASIAAVTCGAKAIFVLTSTGSSAKDLSCSAPPCHVLAITRNEKSARRMHLYKKIMPLLYREKRLGSWQEERLARTAFGVKFCIKCGLLDFKAKLVVLAPNDQGTAYCNGFQIFTVLHIMNFYLCK